MGYLIVSDLHFHNWSTFGHTDETTGVNNRLQYILDSLLDACREAQKRDIDTLYVAGDVFHVRGKVSPSVLNPVVDTFQEITQGLLMDVRMIPGNHDLESKESYRVTNANSVLESLGVDVCVEPVIYHDDLVAMFPWYSNQDELLEVMNSTFEFIESSSFKSAEQYTAIIHAPMNNVIKGIPNTGLNPDDFANWHRVFAGHYHNHKCLDGADRIYSIGALTHQTWSDVGSKCGALLIHSDRVDHYDPKIAPKFVDYDPAAKKAEREAICKGNYVRVKMRDVDTVEIENLKKDIIGFGAEFMQLDLLPKSSVTTRSSRLTSTSSLEESVSDWVELNVDKTLSKSVAKKALDILRDS